MTDSFRNGPHQLSIRARWAIAAIGLAMQAVAWLDMRLPRDQPVYFRGRAVDTLSSDYAVIVLSIYLILVAILGRWIFLQRDK